MTSLFKSSYRYLRTQVYNQGVNGSAYTDSAPLQFFIMTMELRTPTFCGSEIYRLIICRRNMSSGCLFLGSLFQLLVFLFF